MEPISWNQWIVFVLAILILSCSESEIVNTGGLDLLINPSFEKNGSPWVEGWYQTYEDTSMLYFSQDVPQDGGKYSLAIRNGWGPPPSLNTAIAAPAGIHYYKLSAHVKAMHDTLLFSETSGALTLLHQKGDTLITRKWMVFTDSNWTAYSLLDTIAAIQGDSIIVSLRSGHSQWSFGDALFDLVRLEAVE